MNNTQRSQVTTKVEFEKEKRCVDQNSPIIRVKKQNVSFFKPIAIMNTKLFGQKDLVLLCNTKEVHFNGST